MGTYLTEAVIQQLGGPKGLDARALAILKDFAHLANDATSELEGVIEFSVPQYKFTAMSNCGRDAVIRGLKLLKNKQLLVQVSRGNDYTKKASVYQLKLPQGFDKKAVQAKYGNCFGGLTYGEVQTIMEAKRKNRPIPMAMPPPDAPLPPVAPEAKVINNAATSTLDNGSKTLPNGSETLPNGSKMLPQGSQNATPTTIENNSYTKKNKAPLDKGDFDNWKDYAVEVCPGILRFKLEQLKVPKAYEPLVWEAVEIYAHMGETQLAGIKNPPGYLMSLLTTAAKGQPIGNAKPLPEAENATAKCKNFMKALGVDNPGNAWTEAQLNEYRKLKFQLQEKLIGKIRTTCGPDLIRWGEELRDKYHLTARDPLEAVKFLHSVLEPYFAPAK